MLPLTDHERAGHGQEVGLEEERAQLLSDLDHCVVEDLCPQAMSEARQGASVLCRYAYNAWGEQVRKTDGTEAGATLTLYDEAGHWLGDYDHAGRATQQTIWLDDHPIGLMQAGQTYYLETDNLGTPRVAIDPSRDVAVWRWDLYGAG